MTAPTATIESPTRTTTPKERILKEPQARIEDHAMIGDLNTAALVTKDGSIDWLCMPAFDSDACFAALLGTAENGRWRIAPRSGVREVRRRYRKDTLILETEFETDSGTLQLIDFMPPRHKAPHLVRTLKCLRGEVSVRSDLSPRFGFGIAVPAIETVGNATKIFAGPDALYLRGSGGNEAPPLFSDFFLREGQQYSYVLTYGTSYLDIPAGIDPAQAERATEDFWLKWVAQIKAPDQYRDEVVRSLITLKACIYEPTGGIVAAPTTSLPETPGGERNWDYRFTWLRDANLTLGAFMEAGLMDESEGFFTWTRRAIAGNPAQVQIMYGIRGERRLTEAELPWFTGYGGAKPVRIGNAAYEQFQLDVMGEVAMTVYAWSQRVGRPDPRVSRSLMGLAEYVANNWKRGDRGIWEMRGPERDFTASKVSAWMTIDCALKTLGDDSDPRFQRLAAVRQEIFDEVCTKGFNNKLNTFTQYYGGTDLDASLLFIPLSGFLPPDDPRVVGTVAAIERELMPDGFVLRFRPVAETDGLKGEEGVFLACSYWLVDTYCLMGRWDDARRLFEKVTSLSNDLGLLAEEYDPKGKQQLGNFPQAFSHFALVRAAYLLNGQQPGTLHA